MDLKNYYRKIRDAEAAIPEIFPLVASFATEDGGRAGVITEVPRYQAARMIVEGRARLASEEERKAYFEQRAVAQKAADELEAARRVHMSILMAAEQRAVLPRAKPNGK